MSIVGDSTETECMGHSNQPVLAIATPGSDFAGFRILRPLGAGGMGQVFLAEQSVPVVRRVALKLMRAAVVTPELAARFGIEQQALARLEHPNIARLYEAGATQGGFPWFAMELVDGAPLTDYADDHRLSIAQRLALFHAVCDGVRHAHRRGILHRDLKPSNILVANVDGAAQPKIIDFGIAKALDAPAGATLTDTELIGTPAYLAPEALDVASGGADLDTRVDVYALGVILYELLVGYRPHALSGNSLLQMVREVADQDAPMPAQRFAALDPAERTEAAQARGLPEAALARLLDGELGWIASHAVARRREDRYGSVEALIGDLERHARNEPLSVGPPSAWYRLRKLLMRRRGPTAAVLAVFLSLVGGIVAFSIAAERADREARAAEQARTQAERVTGFLIDLFDQADPTRSRGATLTAREILDSGAERIRGDLREEPALRSELLLTLGRVYLSLGLYASAAPLVDEALVLADAPQQRARALQKQGLLLSLQGHYASASEVLARALALVDDGSANLTPDELRDLLNRYAISERLAGRLDHARELHVRELAVAIAESTADDVKAAPAYHGLGFIALSLGDYRSAELLFRRCIEIYERTFGPEDQRLAGPLRALADVFDEQAQHDRSEPLYLRSLAITESVFGVDHPNVAL